MEHRSRWATGADFSARGVLRARRRVATRALERDAISYMSDNYDPLIKTGQMELLQGDAEIVPGVSVRNFPGHTEHMQAVIIESGGGQPATSPT